MRIDIVAFTANGCERAKAIATALDGHECHLFSKTSADATGFESIDVPLRRWASSSFDRSDAIVFVGSIGIAVRSIAPYVRSKTTDPAIVSVDELGEYVIPLLSGHIGGGNDLARLIASRMGARAVITTATDINHLTSIDSFAVRNGLRIGSMVAAKDVSARILDGRFMGFLSDVLVDGEVPSELTPSGSGEAGVAITWRTDRSPFDMTLRLVPPCHVIGVGCRRGRSMREIMDVVMEVLHAEDISPESVRAVASIDLKADETGLLDLCDSMGLDAMFFSAEELDGLEDIGYSCSDLVREVTGVGCVCERAAMAASNDGELVVRKTARDGVTVAVVRESFTVSFKGVSDDC